MRLYSLCGLMLLQMTKCHLFDLCCSHLALFFFLLIIGFLFLDFLLMLDVIFVQLFKSLLDQLFVCLFVCLLLLSGSSSSEASLTLCCSLSFLHLSPSTRYTFWYRFLMVLMSIPTKIQEPSHFSKSIPFITFPQVDLTCPCLAFQGVTRIR